MNRLPVRLMLALAGTNREVLAKAPRDLPKQVSLAGVILTTSGLAFVSSTFALRTALHAPLWAAVLIGLLWGVAIANLDRWLITATTRQPTTWGNLKLALPRMLLAVVIGAVVSTPLTLQIFRGEIENELTVMQAEDQAAFTRQLSQDARFHDLPAQQREVERLQAVLVVGVDEQDVFASPEVVNLRGQLAEVSKQLAKAEQAVLCEKEGTCGSGKVGAGPAFKEKVELRNRLRGERDRLDRELEAKQKEVRAGLERSAGQTRTNAEQQLAELQSRVGSEQAAYDAEIARNQAAVRSSDGLLARLEALERISGQSNILLGAHILLFLFFTAIECLPVLFKLLLSLGEPSLYEKLCTVEDQATYMDTARAFRATHEQSELEVRTALAAEEERRRTQYAKEAEAAELLLEAQRAVVEKAVAAWREEMYKLVDEDYTRFVKDPYLSVPDTDVLPALDPTEPGLETPPMPAEASTAPAS